MKTCIFSSVYDLDSTQMAIFCNSIRRNGYQGDVIITGYGLTGNWDRMFRNNDIEFRLGEPLSHFDRQRWGWYIPYISRYDYVFGCDCKDVVIQSDLDGLWIDGLHITEEAANVGDEQTNTHYVKIAHGYEVFGRIRNTRALNGGTVWGNQDAMLDYCHQMANSDYRGTDQGVMTGLVREGILNAIVHPNRERVWTLALEGYRGYGIPLLPLEHQFIGDKMATLGGHVPDVIHQYNRFPELIERFQDIYGLH